MTFARIFMIGAWIILALVVVYAAIEKSMWLLMLCNFGILALNLSNPVTRAQLSKPVSPALIFALLCIPGVMLSGAAIRTCDNPTIPIILIFLSLGLIAYLIVWRDQRKAAIAHKEIPKE